MFKKERKKERGGTVEEVEERNGHQHVWYEREMHKSREGKKAAGGERRGRLLRYHFPPSTPVITPSDPPLSWLHRNIKHTHSLMCWLSVMSTSVNCKDQTHLYDL